MSGEGCPCGSGKGFDLCCEPYLAGKALPETAEALMRSRYSAYVRQLIPYLKETLWPRDAPVAAARGSICAVNLILPERPCPKPQRP